MLSGKYNLTKLQEDTPEQLFERYPVATLEGIKNDLAQSVSSKRAELRQLVGGKYRDLLKVADDIISMNGMTSKLNSKISDLTFRNSTYDDKTLKNLCAFDEGIRKDQKEVVQKRNRVIVFRNIIHDCVYTYYHLEDDVRSQEGKDNLNNLERRESEMQENHFTKNIFASKVSLEYLQLSKQIYLLFNIFEKEVNDATRQDFFSVREIKSLRKDLIHEIQVKLENLTDTYSYEYATNMLASYVILNKCEPKTALIWFLEIRKQHLFQEDICSHFVSSLSYLYVTISCVTYFKTRLSPTLNRQIHSSTSSNWVAKSSFRKWHKWLGIDITNFTVDFPLSSKQLNINWGDGKLQGHFMEWQKSFTSESTKRFKEKFADCDSLEKMSLSLSDILNSFKMFTSLIELPCINDGEESKISEILLALWRKRFEILLEKEWDEFDNLLNNAVILFKNDDILESNSTSYGINLFTNTDISDINEFVRNASDPDSGSGTSAQLEQNIQFFISNSEAIIGTFINLKHIIHHTERPMFSVDDFENPEFWKNIRKTMFEWVDAYAQKFVVRVNSSVETLFEAIKKIVDSGKSYKPEKLMILIRNISQVSKNLDLSLIYDKINNVTNSGISYNKISVSTLTSPLLSKCIIPAIYKLTKQEITKLGKISKQRWAVNIPEKKYPEVESVEHDSGHKDSVEIPETLIWELYEEKWKLPTTPSVDLEKLLYEMATSLLTKGTDFSDIYLIKEFEQPKKDLINTMLKAIGNSITPSKGQKFEGDLALLTFSDIVFLYFFTCSEANTTDIDKEIQKSEHLSTYIKKLYEANPDLQDEEYRSKIISSVRERFDATKLMYYPF